MNANTFDYDLIRDELENNDLVSHCAKKYGNTGDPTSMKMCYLLRHYPNLSVSQLADLAGVSISAASRCLKKLNHSEVVVARKEGQTVFYSLEDNEFTTTLIRHLEGSAV
jgi:DNA-binding transcriptional ArsR family regulator